MHVKSFQLKNIGPFDSFEVKPKALTIIRGKNGAGKTTIVNSVRYLAEKNHDPTLIKDYGTPKQAKSGEIRLVIADPGHEYDGASYVATITPGRTSRVLDHPKLGQISVARSKEWIDTVINMISLDPVRFLTASDKEQVSIFLQAQPLKVTADQLGFIPVDVLKGVDLDRHALVVLGDKDSGIYGTLYSRRADIKKEGVIRADYAEGLASTLPEDAPEGNWDDALNLYNEEYRTLQKGTQDRVSAIKSDAAKAEEAQRELFRANEKAINEEMEKAVEKIRIDSAIAIKRFEADRERKLAAIKNDREGALNAAQSNYEPRHAAITAQIAKAKAMVDQHTKSESTRNLIAKAKADADEANIRAKNITEALKKIDALKADLLKETRIQGLEVSGGTMMLDGVTLKRVNDAKKTFKVALQIGKMQAGPLGFMVIDNGEKFDEDQLPVVESVAAELGMQVMMTIATARDKDGKPIDGIVVESEVA